MKALIAKGLMFIKTIRERAIDNKNTTLGGGVAGILFATLVGKFEEMSGCKFATVFGNVDWLQLAIYVFSQVMGALTTDANKTVDTGDSDS